jgi:phosphatidylglycerophosphatase A
VRIDRALLTVFGLGLLRPAPGTWGSLPAAGAALALACLALPAWMITAIVALLGLLFAVACLRFGGAGEAIFGRKDPSQIVADEMAGQAIPLLFLPWRLDGDGLGWNALLALTAFVSFRVFDIAKPPPIRGLQRIPGGLGILIDDLLAGLFALVVTQLLARLIWPGLGGVG